MRTINGFLHGLCPLFKLNKEHLYGETARFIMSCQCAVAILLVSFTSLLQIKAIKG